MAAPTTLPAVTTRKPSSHGCEPRTAYTPPSRVMVSPGKGGTTYSSAAASPSTSSPSGPSAPMSWSMYSTIRANNLLRVPDIRHKAAPAEGKASLVDGEQSQVSASARTSAMLRAHRHDSSAPLGQAHRGPARRRLQRESRGGVEVPRLPGVHRGLGGGSAVLRGRGP